MLTTLVCLASTFWPASTVATSVDGPVEDTFVAEAFPAQNFGREAVLEAGPGKAVLIRFPALEWAYTGHERVIGAVMRLRVLGGTPQLKSVRRVLRPWNEGPGSRNFLIASSDGQPKGAAWAVRDAQGSKWRTPGAGGDSDAERIEGAKALVEGDTLLLTGLASAVAQMIQDPTTNYGFRLEFSEEVVFASSEIRGEGPELVVESSSSGGAKGPNLQAIGLEPLGMPIGQLPNPNERVRWRARFVNTGDEPTRGFMVDWAIGERFSVQTIGDVSVPPGGTIDVEAEVPWLVDKSDSRASWLRVVALTTGSKAPARPAIAVPIGGLAVKFSGAPSPSEGPLAAVAQANEAWLAQSRFSFAPDGCRERFRLVTDSPADVTVEWTGSIESMVRDLMTEADPLKAWRVTGAVPPDTRDDSAWPPSRALPVWPGGSPEEGAPPLPEGAKLDGASVAALNAMVGFRGDSRALDRVGVSPSAIVRFQDAGGKPIAGGSLSVRQGDGQLAWPTPFPLTASGAAFLPARGPLGPIGDLGQQPWLDLEVNLNGSVATARLEVFRLISEAARGNQAPFVDLVVKVTSGTVDRSQDLAVDALVSDSKGRFPAELQALTDNDPETKVPMPFQPGDWVEIDLGRDRLIAEVVLGGQSWASYDVYLRRTSQAPEDGSLWCRERGGSVVATALAQRARYIRIVARSAGAPELVSVSVFPLQVAER
ncbi:MAG: hypothetical protein KF884_10270 [Fimbriimonadaceae bacterium]|nr:hypothetical protein [Fimbriimonadaceae bacterium]QYK57931.1 MAG: hypothetical protein KF884_10270 [Fimbriimonadaceae bacterium]